MIIDELPLLELFHRLQEAGLPLGIDEYHLLLRSLQAGFGLPNRAALARLCCNLWVKSAEEKQIFDYHFEQVMQKPVSQSKAVVFTSITEVEQQKVTPRLIRYGALGGIVVLILGSVLMVQSFNNNQQKPTPASSSTPTPTPTSSSTPTPTPTKTFTPSPTPTQIPTPIPTPIISDNFFTSENFLLILITLVLGSVMLLSRISRAKRRKLADKFSTQPNQNRKITTLPAQLNKRETDEIQIAQTLRKAVTKQGFLLNTNYLPVTRRQMKQSWRYLRRLVREGLAVELDVEATVNEIGRQGMLLEPVFVPPRVNRIELILLIDRDGSMVPFHSLSQRLAQTALQGSGLHQVKIYYFHNCPTGYLYHDPAHVEAEPVSKVFQHLHSQRTSVLIFSDGGAACGRWNPERIELTAEFLQQLRQQVRYLAWLNPMPRNRWQGTTAGEIACMLPMFEFNRRGLDEAIAVLRGKTN
ncbi:MAG: hypothetical protein F6K21_16105 [Symploca sp. SIO2D2]|nr:hypothetical protein [Symploca sp. SIO2D2]